MRFGFHISIGGGFAKAVGSAVKTECRAMQLFSRNPRGWAGKEIDLDDAAAFRQAIEESGIAPVVVHLPYLPNLAAGDSSLYEKSILVLEDDLRRAELLGAAYLVTHIGHRGKDPEEKAMARVAQAVNRALTAVNNSVMVLLENTAGQGSEIGCTFAQLKAILDMIENKKRAGICLDTAHAFAAGYDVATAAGLDDTLKELEKMIGIDNLRLIHLNDSKAPLGSRVDRHWHIGQGCIGREGFTRIVNHPLLSDLPAIMETPKKTDDDDLQNMRTVRSLVAKQAVS